MKTVTGFDARFSVPYTDSQQMRVHRSADGDGHLLCAAAQRGLAVALIVEAQAMGANMVGPRAADQLPRLIESWTAVLGVVLATKPAAIRWVYCPRPGSYYRMELHRGEQPHVALVPMRGGRSELLTRAPAVGAWVLAALHVASILNEHSLRCAAA